MDLEPMLNVRSMTLGITGGLIAAFRAVSEIKQSRIQRLREHRWKQRAPARELLSTLKSDDQSASALKMPDGSGRTHDICEQQQAPITFEGGCRVCRTAAGLGPGFWAQPASGCAMPHRPAGGADRRRERLAADAAGEADGGPAPAESADPADRASTRSLTKQPLPGAITSHGAGRLLCDG